MCVCARALLPLTAIKNLSQTNEFYYMERDPDDWGLIVILPSPHVCSSLRSHPRQAFGIDSKCPDVLLTAPLFHIPFGKQHDNYSGMQFLQTVWMISFRLKEGAHPSRCATTGSHGVSLTEPGLA